MKTLMYVAALFAALTMTASCDDKEESITEAELPAPSRVFLQTHFAEVTITRIIRETEGFDKDYSVYLVNGFEIDFRKAGDWDEVDGHINALPQSILDLLPVGIMQYVNTNFPGAVIVKVNKERYGFEIDLNNNIDIEFNENGEFVRYDD